MNIRRTTSFLALIVFLISLPGCFGYHLGNQALYRADVQTVYLPMIESDSLRRNLGERLTEAVAKEIELQTPFKVVHTADADSTLTCRLTTEGKRLLVQTQTSEPRDLEYNMIVAVSWADRRGESLMQNYEVQLPLALQSSNQAVDFLPEAGQSVATAQQEAIQKLAGQIVSQMQVWW